MFQELKEDIKALKIDVSVIKKGSGHSDIDEIESLFSSLESSASASQPHVSPFQHSTNNVSFQEFLNLCTSRS